MTFRKTACLASLLLSFPLAVPTLSVAAGDWDVGSDTGKTSGTAKESGESKENPHTETLDDGTYVNIYIGHAERQGTAEGKAEANYNKAELGSGIIVTKNIYGGSATTGSYTYNCDGIDLEAKGNTIIMENGSSVDSGTSRIYPAVYGGYAQSYAYTCTADASENTVTIKEGASFKAAQDFTNKIYGGYAYLTYAKGESTATASDNFVTIEEGATFASNILVYAGYAYTNNASGTVTASDNTLNINKLANATTSYIKIGYANANGTGAAVASGNKGTWVFENVTLAQNVIGGHAHSEGGTADANKNEMTVTGGSFKSSDVWVVPRLYAGWAEGTGEVNANGNITSLTSAEQQGYFAGGYATELLYDSGSNVHANSNITTITDSTMAYVRGGYALDGAYAEAKENKLTMTGGDAYKVYAGQASINNYGDAASQKKTYVWKNTLTVQNTVADYVYGGYSSAINDDEDEDISVSKKEAYASENTLIVSGGFSIMATAGHAESDNTAEATDNYVYLNYDPESQANLETETTISGALYGGYAEGTKAKATGNKGILVNASFSDDGGEFSGGIAVAANNDGGEATASQNIFSITGGSLANVYGGQAISSTDSSTATADDNVLTLSGAEVRKTLYGGYASSTLDDDAADSAVSGDASAKTNTLSLYGGTYGGDIYAGYASTTSTNSKAESGSNTIDLYALNGDSPSFAETTVIWGGYAAKGGTEVASTGNTLKFNDVKGMKAANIKNFQNLTFTYDNTTLATNDVVLTLTGTEADADSGRVAEPTTTIADGGEISVSVTSLKGEGDEAVFKKGEKVYLLQNKNGLDIQTNNLTLKTTTAKTGNGALVCTITLEKDGNSLYLTRTDSDGDDAIKATPETKAIAEGALAGLALASESHEAVFEVIDEIAEQDIFTFGTVHASNKTYESGSSITVSSVSLIAGLGKGFDTGAGHLNIGAFFEYGKGSYTTHNSFDDRAGIDGDGSSWYMGGGILAKMNFKDTGPGHFYVEGSAHMGTVHNEFDSNGFTDGFGNVAKFDMDSPYYSLHGGLGYVWNFAEGHELKMYGKYIWTMVQGTDDTLTTNAKFDYDDMHSNRVRAGVRYSYTGSERFKPYVGVAYEHEFSGSCDSRAYGYDVNSPSYEGGTGIGELGIAMMPTASLPLSFNLGVQGSVGKKRGVSGTCNVVYEF